MLCWHLPKGLGTSLAVQDMQGSMFSPSPSPALEGSSVRPPGTVVLGGIMQGHCMILGGFDSSAGTSNSTRAPCHDHSPQQSPGPSPQEHRAAPTQQAYSKEDTLPTATFLLLEFTRYKELDLHATCHRLGLLCPSVCHAGREEGGWQRQAPPDWCLRCSQGFPCSLCDRHHFCCDGFALPAMSKHYGRGKSPMGQELGPLS